MVMEIKSRTAKETFADLTANTNAVLIDVRTSAEWAFLGVPQVEGLKTVMWQDFPDGVVNINFIEQVAQAGVDKDDTVYLLCRSGVRSHYAAQALLGAGYSDLTNVSDGYEGDLDQNGHRNTVNGWRHAGLPWRQS